MSEARLGDGDPQHWGKIARNQCAIYRVVEFLCCLFVFMDVIGIYNHGLHIDVGVESLWVCESCPQGPPTWILEHSWGQCFQNRDKPQMHHDLK